MADKDRRMPPQAQGEILMARLRMDAEDARSESAEPLYRPVSLMQFVQGDLQRFRRGRHDAEVRARHAWVFGSHACSPLTSPLNPSGV